MGRAGETRGIGRLMLAAAVMTLCGLAPAAIAEIPTTAVTADGGSAAPAPKSTPRPEQRTTEQRPASALSLG